MVLSGHETSGPEWPVWRWWLTRIAVASVIFAGLWWAVSRDKTGTLIAAAIPWGFAVGGLAVTLTWAVVFIPLLTLVGKFWGRESKKK